MALPPERITIKRRREEEPVETLYIEQKRQRSHYVWCRVSDGQYLSKPDTLSSPLPRRSTATRSSRREYVTPRVPSLRTTSPSEDVRCKSIPASSQLNSPKKKIQNPLKAVSKPRTFHLCRGSASSITQTTAMINGIRKSKTRRQDLPCFVETIKKHSKLKGSRNLPIEKGIVLNKAECDSQLDKNKFGSNPRKRPLVNDVEKKWRNENWIMSARKDNATPDLARLIQYGTSTGQWDHQSTTLIENLHKIALQEAASLVGSGVGYPDQREPKIKPKPSKARCEDILFAMSEHELGKTNHNYENQDDVVYDTFVRTYHPSSSMDSSTPDIDMLDIVDRHKIGILIIAEEDQSEWETFGEDEESDKDWNSEEEDENAEDFYGNDYPEDEVDSDDEYGRNAYNFRKYASDDEEYAEESTWTDEDHEGSNRWKSNEW